MQSFSRLESLRGLEKIWIYYYGTISIAHWIKTLCQSNLRSTIKVRRQEWIESAAVATSCCNPNSAKLLLRWRRDSRFIYDFAELQRLELWPIKSFTSEINGSWFLPWRQPGLQLTGSTAQSAKQPFSSLSRFSAAGNRREHSSKIFLGLFSLLPTTNNHSIL